MTAELDALLPVLEARYGRDAAALAAARADEAQAVQAIADLEERARAVLGATALPHHATGASTLWQDEARRRRAALLRELALARARVGEAETRLRGSLARKVAVAKLAAEEADAGRRRAARRAQDATLSHLILGSG